jgi:formate dehydrogenase iron-sulfur subunit
MHCLEPSCVSACPVHALRKEENGAVVYHPEICMGCRYCMMACPFGIPTLEWEKPIPFIKKCTFCSDRMTTSFDENSVNDTPLSADAKSRFEDGHKKPACAKTCPTDALMFGKRSDLLTEAKKRISEGNGKYVNHIYGEKEAGGTAWMYISGVEFSKISGFPMNVGEVAYPKFTQTAMDSVPWIVAGGGVVLGGLFWLYNRKQEIMEGEE